MHQEPLTHYAEVVGRMCGILEGVHLSTGGDLSALLATKLITRLSELRDYHDAWLEQQETSR